MFRMAVICKVVLNDDMRRFELAYPLSLSALLESIVAKFGLDRSAKLRLVWIDSDGDLITVCSDATLVEAFSTTSGAPLRLQLVPAASPLITKTSAPSAAPATETPKEDTAREVRLQRAQLKLAHLRAFRARLEAREQAMKERTSAAQGHMAQERARLTEREQRLLGKFPELATMAPVELPALGDLRKRMMFGAEREEFRGPRGFGGCPRFNPEAATSVVCDDCEAPITRSDVRFKCGDCENFDLCAVCEPKTSHDATHVLLKLRPEAQEERPFLPIHRPMLRPKFGGKHHHFGGRHGFPHHGPHHDGPHHGPFGGRHGFPHHGGPFGGRFGHCGRRGRRAAEAEATAKPVLESLEAVKQVFEQLLPEIQAKLASAGLTELNVKQIFEQLLQSVQTACPALFEQLAQIAQDLMASATEITIETVLPRLEQLIQTMPDLLTPGLIDQLLANVLPAIGACLAQVSAAGLDVANLFGSACSFAQLQPEFSAPAPLTPERETEAEDFSPLAALSIPPEILDQLTQIASNPQEALNLWEAMQ